MSIGIEIKDGVTPAIKEFEGRARDVLEKKTLRVAEDVAGEIRRQVMQRLSKDPTGNLARSFRPSILSSSKGALTVGVFSDLVYAEIQDQGGTILPRKKKLAVPLPGAPVPRGKWPRDFKRGDLFRMGSVLAKARKRGKPIPMFALVDKVQIKGTGYIAAAIEASTDNAEKTMGEGVELVITESIKKGSK